MTQWFLSLALDAKGKQAFYQLYRNLPDFMRCNQCPHGYLDTGLTHMEVVEVALHTWHREPEQRPAGGPLEV